MAGSLRRLAPRWAPYKTSYSEDLAIYDTWPRRMVLVAMAIAFVATPSIFDPFYLNLLNLIAIATIGVVGLNILMGLSGQVSVGNAAFMAVGAYTTAALVQANANLPFLAIVPLAGLAAAVVGAVVGLPALRLRGLYLVMSTLSAHFIVLYLVQRYQLSVVGPGGFFLPEAEVLGIVIDEAFEWFYVLGAFAGLSLLFFTNLLRSRFGRAWMALREGDIAAAILGVPVSSYKILAFVVSSFLIGIQGSLYGYYLQAVQVEAFNFDLAVQFIAMVIIGGQGSVLGSVFGAAFVTGLPFLVQRLAADLPSDAPGYGFVTAHIFDLQVALYGAAIILFLLLEPDGLVEIWRRIRMYFALWPFSRERAGDE